MNQSTPLTPTLKTMMTPIGQLFSESWEFFKTNLNKLILITLILMSPSILNQILSLIFGNKSNPVIGTIMGLLVLLSIVTGIWGTIALITFITEKNPALTISEAYNKNVSLFWSYLWLSIVIGLIVLAGLILVIIPGIIWGIYFSLFSYILICEKIKGWAAAKKSKQLVKKYWWPVFGRVVLLSLIFIVLSLILSPISYFSELLYSLIIIIISLLYSPFATVYSYNIYQNLKQIKGI